MAKGDRHKKEIIKTKRITRVVIKAVKDQIPVNPPAGKKPPGGKAS